MIRFIKYKLSNGHITMSGNCQDMDFETQAEEGFGVLQHPTATPHTHKVVEGIAVEYTSQGKERMQALPESPESVWDPAQEIWVDNRTLLQLKEVLLAKLKRKRDSLLEGGFIWDGSPFDSDISVSQPRLLGLFTAAINGLLPPGGQTWRLADNSWRTLSAADAIAVWGAFQTHMALLFQAFAIHESVVQAETDIEQLRTYDTASGWPV